MSDKSTEEYEALNKEVEGALEEVKKTIGGENEDLGKRIEKAMDKIDGTKSLLEDINSDGGEKYERLGKYIDELEEDLKKYEEIYEEFDEPPGKDSLATLYGQKLLVSKSIDSIEFFLSHKFKYENETGGGEAD